MRFLIILGILLLFPVVTANTFYPYPQYSDLYASEQYPTTNYYQNNNLVFGQGTSNYDYNTYIKFNMSAFSGNTSIKEAYLHIYVDSYTTYPPDSLPQVVRFCPLYTDYTPSTMTWNSGKPSGYCTTSCRVDISYTPSGGTWEVFNITKIMDNWVADNGSCNFGAYYGLEITHGTTNKVLSWGLSNKSGFGPYIETYGGTPYTPPEGNYTDVLIGCKNGAGETLSCVMTVYNITDTPDGVDYYRHQSVEDEYDLFSNLMTNTKYNIVAYDSNGNNGAYTINASTVSNPYYVVLNNIFSPTTVNNDTITLDLWVLGDDDNGTAVSGAVVTLYNYNHTTVLTKGYTKSNGETKLTIDRNFYGKALSVKVTHPDYLTLGTYVYGYIDPTPLVMTYDIEGHHNYVTINGSNVTSGMTDEESKRLTKEIIKGLFPIMILLIFLRVAGLGD